MQTFWASLALIFLAELGDKTQLVALTLAARYNARVVLAGIFTATLVVHVISVILGMLVGGLLPAGWVALLAGLAFIGFGVWTLRGDSLDEDECRRRRQLSPFWVVTVTFFCAELGDKTMLSTVTLATESAILWVWLGSTAGMVLSDGFAIIVGRLLGARLPERAVKIGAALVFFGFGLVKAVQGAQQLPLSAVVGTIAAAVVGALAYVGVAKWLCRQRAAAQLASGK